MSERKQQWWYLGWEGRREERHEHHLSRAKKGKNQYI